MQTAFGEIPPKIQTLIRIAHNFAAASLESCQREVAFLHFLPEPATSIDFDFNELLWQQKAAQ